MLISYINIYRCNYYDYIYVINQHLNIVKILYKLFNCISMNILKAFLSSKNLIKFYCSYQSGKKLNRYEYINGRI